MPTSKHFQVPAEEFIVSQLVDYSTFQEQLNSIQILIGGYIFLFLIPKTKDQPFSFACFCVYRQSSFKGKGSSKAVERIREEVLFYTAAARRNNKAQ